MSPSIKRSPRSDFVSLRALCGLSVFDFVSGHAFRRAERGAILEAALAAGVGRMKVELVALSLVLLSAIAFSQAQPKNGYVSDAGTAVKIAEAVLFPIYGEEQIKGERLFKATLKDEVWTVVGTVNCSDVKPTGPAPTIKPGFKIEKSGCYGGAAEIRIAKEDARILFVTHYK